LTMISRYCEGRVPAGTISEERLLQAKRAGVDTDETTISGFIALTRDQFLLHLESFAFSKALELVWSIVARIDKMISDAKPWELAKDENQSQTLNAVLYRAAETLRWLCVLLYPIMPTATVEIWNQLGLGDSSGSGELLSTPAKVNPANLKWGELPEGTAIGEVRPLFPRIDKTKTMAGIKDEESGSVTTPTIRGSGQLNTDTRQAETGSGTHATEADAVPDSPTGPATKPVPPMHHATEADAVPASAATEGVTSLIEITDFSRIDLRVGEVLTAERIPKADKLLLLSVDIGEEKPRQILAGIAQYYEPDQLVGRKIAVVANLKPRKMRGHESQGMLLAASVGEEGKPVIATFTEDVPNGARLK
jgi:methionyl-tRNA synthetase